ncbi:MAG TPA: zinc ribbon domain-containing protein [Pyrinomonadaceae bacterium]|jgi:hypothetical protein|nr:zinc ribbon domain-containing protein [Pyrinomonadaceae bacterium]
MHCPSCGAEAQLTQKFCRSCGLSLEKVPQLVAEQLSGSEEIITGEVVEKLHQRQRQIEHWLSTAGLGFIALAGVSILIGLIYLLVAGSLPLVPGTVLLILVLGGMVAGSLAIYSENLKKKLSGANLPKSRTLRERESKLPLDAYHKPFVSVTERTTNLLEKDDKVEPASDQRMEGGA